MRMPLGCLAMLQAFLVSPGTAQAVQAPRSPWSVAVSIGTSTFNGSTSGIGDGGEKLVFAPYRPTMLGIAVAYGREKLRIGLTARNGDAGIGFRGVPVTDEGEALPGVLIIAEDSYTLTSVTGSVSTRLARLGGGPALRSSLGLTMERWTAPGAAARTIFGPQAGLSLEIGLTAAFTATIEGELGFTPSSPFREEDLPEGFRERSTWRRTLVAGVSWRP